MKDKKIALKILDAISKVVGKKKLLYMNPYFGVMKKSNCQNV